jgi:hypothetical protein
MVLESPRRSMRDTTRNDVALLVFASIGPAPWASSSAAASRTRLLLATPQRGGTLEETVCPRTILWP